MSSANVLPSAPEHAKTVQQLSPMQEITQINAEDFRLKKISDLQRGSYRGITVMRDWLILFSVKREFNKLFFVIRDLKVLRDP